MRWNDMLFEATEASMRERGRPWPRLARGLIWALIVIAVLSIVIFTVFLFAPPPHYVT